MGLEMSQIHPENLILALFEVCLGVGRTRASGESPLTVPTGLVPEMDVLPFSFHCVE